MGLLKKKPALTVSDIRSKLPRKITYVGLEKGDLVIALAVLLTQAGLKVVLLDNSITHDIYDALKDEGDDGVVVRGSLTVARNRIVDADRADADTVIEYAGTRRVSGNGTECLVLAASPRRQSIDAVRDAFGYKCAARYVLLRDADGIYTPKGLCHDLGIQSPGDIMVIPWDVKEDISYCAYTRKHDRPLGTCFTETAPVLYRLAESLTGMSEAQIKKIMAKGGVL